MSQHRAQPTTALSPEYLVALRERDEPVNATDPDIVGPWRIREAEGRFHIFREWESFASGHRPAASFGHREDALLFSIALRVCRGPAIYRVREGGPPSLEGYPVEREGQLVGTVKTDRPELQAIVHALASVARSPVDLALLFELAGSGIQEMTGEILADAILGDEDATVGK
jgi:hypothetical protein